LPSEIVLLSERFLDGCIYDEINVKRVKYAYAQGNMVASHTWDHKDLTKLTFDQIHDELYRVELAFERLLGVTPAFMRPPYGNYNNLVRQVAAQRGQKLVLWDFDSGDSTGSTPAQSDKAYDALIKKHPGTILPLNHEVYSTFFSFRLLFFCRGLRDVRLLNIVSSVCAENTAEIVLPHAIKALKKAGYKLVTVAECVGLQPYQSVTSPKKVSLQSCSVARCLKSLPGHLDLLIVAANVNNLAVSTLRQTRRSYPS
jgi:peptidoglycan/xylan/chitin deacetylase (PgdA/CDA1 family)